MNIYVHSCTNHNCQTMEPAKMPINGWMDYKTMGYVHNGILLSYKKEQNYIIYREMDGTGEHYTKWD